MLARSDLDFIVKAERPAGPRRAQSLAALVLCRMMHPGLLRAVALTGFAAFVAIVAINALVLQKARHPAPLLGAMGAPPSTGLPAAVKAVKVETVHTPMQANAPASTAEAVPLVALPAAPAPVPPLSTPPTQATGGIAALVPPPRPRPQTAVTASDRPRDPIARLLGANDSIGSGLEPNKTVLMAQRALLKVGYVIRPDGMMGATTRQALEQFERDRRLPIKGELSVRVRRELSVMSGIPVE
jgi:Putative peptidoglycan binding domain